MGILQSKIPVLNICGPVTKGRILNSDYSGRIYLLPKLGGRQSGVRQVSILSELTVGETGVLVALDLPESVQNHLMHMGFVPDALITALRRAPAGDPTVYAIDGMEIALRHETASAIRVRSAVSTAAKPAENEESLGESAEPLIETVVGSIQLAEVAQ